MAFAYEAHSKGDEDKAANAIRKLTEEDPTLDVHRDPQTGEQIIAGLSQIHVEVVVDRMKRRFGASIDLHPPQVPYIETIRRPAKAHGRYKKQTGGRGQFGDCQIEIEPNGAGEGFEFVNAIKGGVIPGGFIPAVEKGIVEQMANGVLAGYPMKDVRVRLFDGQHHNVDSSEMAFKIAGSMAFKQAVAEADAYLLEPIMQMSIAVPEDAVGDVIGDLNSRRGRPLGMEPKGSGDRDQGRGADGGGPRLRAGPARDHRRQGRLHDGVPALRGGPRAPRIEGDRRREVRRHRRGQRLTHERLVVNVDGGARGNPGPAAIAAVVTTPAGETVDAIGEAIGEATNNVAEYRALLLGIERARELGAERGRARRRLGARRQAGEGRVQGQGRDPARAPRPGPRRALASSSAGRSATSAASRTKPPTRSSTRLSTKPKGVRHFRFGYTAELWIPWKLNGMWCGTLARAISVRSRASRMSRNEVPRSLSRTTESRTPSSSPLAPGSATNTGSPG